MELTAQNICFSGGAGGADLAWGAAAAQRGDTVIHFSFRGHRTQAPRALLCVLGAAALRGADPHLRRAARYLQRPWPPASAYALSLLRRDWHQVKDSERLYAVGSFRRDGHIAGGTAWTVAMFLDRHRGTDCDAFFFDQQTRLWLRWSGEWVPIAKPPTPHGRWTGIGTRRLSAIGADAIRGLLADQ